MKILKNNRVAAAVLAAVILIMTPVGISRSVGDLIEDTEAAFYNGVRAEGYTSASIQSHLDNSVKAALGLITVGANFDELTDETDALRDSRNDLIEAKTIGEKYEASEAMHTAADTLYGAIIAAASDADTLQDAEAYATTLSDIRGAISLNGYNDLVLELMENELSRFPASLFAGDEGPQLFGGK